MQFLLFTNTYCFHGLLKTYRICCQWLLCKNVLFRLDRRTQVKRPKARSRRQENDVDS